MSMMVNRVSNVSFRANSAPVPDDFLSRPGAYSKSEQVSPASNQAPKKKHSALKVIAGIVVAAAAVAGGLYLAYKHGGNVFDAAKKFEDISKIENKVEKYKTYMTTVIAKGGKKVEKGLNYVTEGCTELWNKLFKKAETAVNPSAGATGEALTEAGTETAAAAS